MESPWIPLNLPYFGGITIHSPAILGYFRVPCFLTHTQISTFWHNGGLPVSSLGQGKKRLSHCHPRPWVRAPEKKCHVKKSDRNHWLIEDHFQFQWGRLICCHRAVGLLWTIVLINEDIFLSGYSWMVDWVSYGVIVYPMGIITIHELGNPFWKPASTPGRQMAY